VYKTKHVIIRAATGKAYERQHLHQSQNPRYLNWVLVCFNFIGKGHCHGGIVILLQPPEFVLFFPLSYKIGLSSQ